MNINNFYFEDPLNLSSEEISSFFSEIKSCLDEEIKPLKIYTPSGKSVSIEINENLCYLDKPNARVYIKNDNHDCLTCGVDINAYLIRRILLASKHITTTPNHNKLADLGSSTINNGEFRTNKTCARKSAFYIMIIFTALHEISHVILGHLSYEQEKTFLSDATIKLLEAEADRKACQILAELFCLSLKRNKNSYAGLSFSSIFSASEFYVYVFTLFFKAIQDPDKQSNDSTHPEFEVRLQTVVYELLQQFEKEKYANYTSILFHMYASMLNVEKPLHDCIDRFPALFECADEMMTFDRLIANTNIEKYKYRIEY